MKRRDLLALPLVTSIAGTAAGRTGETELVAASLATLDARMPTAHPRLLLRRSEVGDFTAFLSQDPRVGAIAPAMRWLNDRPSGEAPPPEPLAALGKGSEETAAARTAWRISSNAAITAQHFGLRHLVFEKPADRIAGIRWLTALTGWQMSSAADYWRNPEAFVQSFNGMVFAYDWLYQGMTTAERQYVEGGLGTRLNTLFAVMRKRLSFDGAQTPADGLSHPIRYLSVLGHAAMALWGHHAAAKEQLAWIVSYYNDRFPIWGGDDGGWSEGIEYQSSGLSQHLRLLEDLFTLGVTTPLEQPFWRNTGYFLARFLPPYDSSSFSDLPTPPRPTASRRLLLDKLARLNRDGRLLTLAERYGATFPGGMDYYQFGAVDSIFHVWRTSQRPRLQAESVDDLPRSWHFKDVGWVSLQSDWDPRGEAIMLGFKSSPIGSVSHGFADQNAFVINAYRHAMAVSTGMRDWFGSPHYERWTRATRSKNAVLINGQGAPVHDASATGQIVRFVSGRNADFVTGDASAAYRGLAKRVLRHVLFVDRRYFVMLDEITGDVPSKHQWLLHARVKMQIDDATARIDMRWPDAGLQTHLLYPPANKMILTQADRHDPAPEAAPKSIPAEWHATAECRVLAKDRQFLAVLQPWRGQEPRQPVLRAEATVGHAIRVGDDTVLIADEAAGRASTPTHQLQGRAAYQLAGRLVMIDGLSLKTPTGAMQSDAPVTVELEQAVSRWTLELQAHASLVLTLTTRSAPVRVSGPNDVKWTVSSDGQQLRLQLPAAVQPTHLRLEW